VLRAPRRLSLVALVAVAAVTFGSAAPAGAATTRQLAVVLVTELTGWTAFPYTETFAGSGVGSDGQVWTFTETVSYSHFLASGSFSMQAGADGLSGTVRKSPNYVPFVPLGYDLEAWSYTVTDGAGTYAGCTGPGHPVRERATVLAVPPNGVVVETIVFDLTCP